MISERLKRIFFISIPIFILHAAEEYLTLFYSVDFVVKFSWQYETPQKQQFILTQLAFWAVLLTFSLLIAHRKLSIHFLILFGLVYISQLEHVIHAIMLRSYYPGLVTGVVLPVIGFFFWKELLKCLFGENQPSSSSV